VTTGSTFYVLVVDDNPDILAMFKPVLEARGYGVTLAPSGEAAVAALDQQHFDLVITDLKMGQVDGMAVVARADRCKPMPLVVVMTGYASLDTAMEAMIDSAHDYLTKPFTQRELETVADRVTAHLTLKDENNHLVAELADAYRLIAELSHRQDMVQPVSLSTPVTEEGTAETDATMPLNPPEPPPVLSEEAIAAYRAVAWQPERTANRLRILYQQGAISRDEFDRLRRLLPGELPVV
jgi:CheY-like chemotaxis protein